MANVPVMKIAIIALKIVAHAVASGRVRPAAMECAALMKTVRRARTTAVHAFQAVVTACVTQPRIARRAPQTAVPVSVHCQ